MEIPADHVEIRSEDGKLKLRSRLGQEPPLFSGGVGGFEVVTRPGRRPLTPFRGQQDALKLTLPLLLDRFLQGHEGKSVEDQCRVLERMGGLDRGDPEPPHLIVEGSLPHDESRAKQNRWVIDTLEWGDAIRRSSDGHRVRQQVTATLLQFTEDDALSRRKRAKKPGSRIVRAKKGDTFEKLAKQYLGSAHLGSKLAKFNGKRSDSAKLKQGTQVRIPAGQTLKEWKKGR